MGRLPALLAANVAFAAGLFVHALLYNFYLERLGYTPLEMGYAQAALTAGGLILLLPAGRLVDRFGPRAATLLACLVTGAGLAAGALARSELTIYAAAALSGAGTATWRVAGGPLMLAVTPAPFRARAFSWNVGLLVAGGGGLFLLAGALAERLTDGGRSPLDARRLVLLGGAALTAASLLLFARLPATAAVQRPGPAAADQPAPLTHWTEPRLLGAVAAVFVWMLAAAMTLPFFNLYFARVHHMNLTATGAVLGSGQIVTALAVLASAELAQRRGPAAALRVWLWVLPPLLLGFALGPAFGIATVLYVGQGFAAPATNPLIDQLVLERVATAARGRAASWRNVATEASGAVGASVGGAVLAGGSFAILFASAGAVAVTGAFALGAVFRRQPR